MGEPNYDLLGPFAGECAFCGGPDKRHRMYDAVVACLRAGDSRESVARGYDLPLETVLEIERLGVA